MTRWKITASQAAYRAGSQRIPIETRSIHSLSASYQQSNQSASYAPSDKILSKDSARKEPNFDAFLSLRNATPRKSRQKKPTSWTPNHGNRSEKRSTSSSKPYNSEETASAIPTTWNRSQPWSRPRPPINASKPTPPIQLSQPETISSVPTIESYTPSFSFSSPTAPVSTPRSSPSISKHDLLALMQHARPSSSSSPAQPKLPLTFHIPTDLLEAVENQKQGDSKNLLESLLVSVMSRSHQAQQVMTPGSTSPRQTADGFSRSSTEQDNAHPIRTADIDRLILRILSPAYENPANISLLLNLLPMLLSFAPERSRYMSPKTIAFLLFNSSDPIKGFEYLDSQCQPEDQAEMFSPTDLGLIWKAWVGSTQPYQALQHAQTRLRAMGLSANEETFDDHILGILLRYPAVHHLETVVRNLPSDFQKASRGQPTEFIVTMQDVLVRLFDLAEIAEDKEFLYWISQQICQLSRVEPIKKQAQSVCQQIQAAAEVVVLDFVERWDLPGMRTQISNLTRYLDPLDSIIIPPRWTEQNASKDDTVSGCSSCTPVDLDILDRISRTWADDRKGRLWKALVKGSALEDGQSWKSMFQIYLLGSKGIHHELQRPDEMIFPVIDTLGKNLGRYTGDQKKKFAREVLVDKAFIHTLMATPAFRLTPSDSTGISISTPAIVPAALSDQAGRIIRTILEPFLRTPVLPRTENKLYDALLESLSHLTTYQPVLGLGYSKDALRHLLTLAPSPALMVRTIRLFLLFRPHQTASSATTAAANDEHGWSRSILSPELAAETANSILSRLYSTPDVSQPGPILDLVDLSNEIVGVDTDVETKLSWLRRLLRRYIEILTLLDLPAANPTSNEGPSLDRRENKRPGSKGTVNKAYRAHQLGEIQNAIIKVERWAADRPGLFAPSSSTSTVKSSGDVRGLIAQIKLKSDRASRLV
ncbi:hypothetical protein [Phaffia rhodozyma]|uniref:Uncharacterized protein n=1 Tax=Phaffia rhodozyma TaxID=264483 RepID=A0A0F7SSW1_PHARH|nr:hypothetical protein [Phaffia rhodozyma]